MNNCNIFLIFAQNIDRGYTLETVLTSTHDQCFRTKKENKCILLFYIKVGCKGVYTSG